MAPESPAAPVASAVPRAVVTFAGSGLVDTAPQVLFGNYTVTVSDAGCRTGDPSRYFTLVRTPNEAVPGGGIRGEGTAAVLGLARSRYYVSAIAECAWKLTFTPR